MFPPPNIPTLLATSGLVGTVCLIDRNRRQQLHSATDSRSCSTCSISPAPLARIFGGRAADSSPASSLSPSSSSSSSHLTPVVGDLAMFSSPEITKAEIGRASWFFLHSVAANFPDKPTQQQQKDAKALVDVLTRIYPCQECAKHFAKVIKEKPVRVGTGHEFRTWMCEVHNVVNLRLGKPTFNCELVEARWGRLVCEEAEACRIRGAD